MSKPLVSGWGKGGNHQNFGFWTPQGLWFLKQDDFVIVFIARIITFCLIGKSK